MSGTVYSTIVKGAAGAILGAATVRTWSSPIIGAVAGVVLIVRPNPHQALIAAAAISTICEMVERYVWDQRLFSLVFGATFLTLIDRKLMKEMGPIMDAAIVGYYLPALIDRIARHHLGQVVLGAATLFVAISAMRKRAPSQPIEKEKYRITDAELERAKTYFDTPDELEKLPRAIFGKLDVRFLDDLVLKKSEDPTIWIRSMRMKEAHQLCADNGYEDLVIPRARTYKNHFLVESKLPIALPGIKDQISLYFAHRDLFTNAVRELTGFLFQAPIPFIVGPLGEEFPMNIGRYDNVSLYLENGKGKIGLVDIERMESHCIPVDKIPQHKDLKRRLVIFFYRILSLSIKLPEQLERILPRHEMIWATHCKEVCTWAIYLFPLHFEEILDTAEQFTPISSELREDLAQLREHVLENYRRII